MTEQEQCATELVPRRVVAREQQATDHRLQFVRTEAVTVLGRLYETRHEIVARSPAPIVDEGIDVHCERPRRLCNLVEVLSQLEREHVRERVSPPREAVIVVARNTENLADHLHRIAVGEVGNKVAPPARDETIGQVLDQGVHLRSVTVRGAWCERPGHQSPKPRMVCAVGREHARGEHLLEPARITAEDPHQARDGRHQPGIGEQPVHVLAPEHGYPEGRAGDGRPAPQVGPRALEVGLHRGIEEVQERSVGERAHR